MPDAKQVGTGEAAEASVGSELATGGAERIHNGVAELEKSRSRQVLTQRVIVLNGTPDGVAKSPKQRVVVIGAEPFVSAAAPTKSAPPPLQKQPIHLAATSLEWGPQLSDALASLRVPDAQDTQDVQASLSPKGPQDAVDVPWATYSSISMQPCDDLRLPQHILRSNIEDATTTQYNPASAARAFAAGSTSTDLASLDRALESAGVLRENAFVVPLLAPPAPQPAVVEPVETRMVVVPASLVWTLLGIFAVCALALAYLLAAFLVCRSPSVFDVGALRCVTQADAARTR